jgi:hypothetical protein
MQVSRQVIDAVIIAALLALAVYAQLGHRKVIYPTQKTAEARP